MMDRLRGGVFLFLLTAIGAHGGATPPETVDFGPLPAHRHDAAGVEAEIKIFLEHAPARQRRIEGEIERYRAAIARLRELAAAVPPDQDSNFRVLYQRSAEQLERSLQEGRMLRDLEMVGDQSPFLASLRKSLETLRRWDERIATSGGDSEITEAFAQAQKLAQAGHLNQAGDLRRQLSEIRQIYFGTSDRESGHHAPLLPSAKERFDLIDLVVMDPNCLLPFRDWEMTPVESPLRLTALDHHARDSSDSLMTIDYFGKIGNVPVHMFRPGLHADAKEIALTLIDDADILRKLLDGTAQVHGPARFKCSGLIATSPSYNAKTHTFTNNRGAVGFFDRYEYFGGWDLEVLQVIRKALGEPREKK